MAISNTCNTCSASLGDGETILCPTCAKTQCCECEEPAAKLYCEDCAVDEFGEDNAGEIAGAIDSGDIADLASAIRRGDRDNAEYILDRVASSIDGWPDAVSLGRYSPRARSA